MRARIIENEYIYLRVINRLIKKEAIRDFADK